MGHSQFVGQLVCCPTSRCQAVLHHLLCPEHRFRLCEVFGKFRRVIPLAAAINTHKAEARLKGGVLSVRFPKVSNKRGEEVNIPVQNVEE